MTNFSTLGLNLALTNSLQLQQIQLGQLSQEVSSGQKYSDFSQYNPLDAQTVLNGQSSITQRQSYISSMQNVQSRLSVYDTTMTDIENMAAQANSLAAQNAAYNPSTVDNVQQSASNYLRQITDDLNQQVSGRYIYSGIRYNTKPVTDLTALSDTIPTAPTSSPALPDYDTQFGASTTSFDVNTASPSGSFNIGGASGISIPWSALSTGDLTGGQITINGTSYTPNPPITLLSPAATNFDIAANLSTTLNALAAQLPSTDGISGLTTTASTGTVTLNFNNTTALSVTPNSGGTTGEIVWDGGGAPDGTTAQTPPSSSPAYTNDKVLIDAGFNVTYGVSSNDPAFQNVINAMRLIVAACAAGKSGDTATYKSDMSQASTMMGTGLSGVQNLHAGVADNQNIMSTSISTQTADITNLQNQMANIQNADMTLVGTEINSLQNQLQASYSATSSLEKLSLVKYL